MEGTIRSSSTLEIMFY